MFINSGEAGGREIEQEDGRSWFEISTILYIILGIFGTSNSFKCDFINEQYIHNVFDTQEVGVMAFNKIFIKD
jgi:hypothetical protein